MTIGWYVHHHGAGHLHRFAAVSPHLPDVVGLSSLPAPAGCEQAWVRLPLDDEAGPHPAAGGVLHWAPIGCDGLRDRMAAISAWIACERPAAMVVDVSVEVTLLARLHGVPTVVAAQRGVRDDPPHRAAYASAAAVVAPWTAVTHLADDGVDASMFTGAISRFDALPAPPPPDTRDVLLLLGAGGHGLTANDVRAAAAATPDRIWHVAGALRAGGHPRVIDHGAQADVWGLLGQVGVVVGSAGGNVVAEVAAARRPFVCLPQARPFDEQERQGEALRRLGVAEVLRRVPLAGEWPDVLSHAERRDTTLWAVLHDGRGAARFAETVERVAGRVPTCA